MPSLEIAPIDFPTFVNDWGDFHMGPFRKKSSRRVILVIGVMLGVYNLGFLGKCAMIRIILAGERDRGGLEPAWVDARHACGANAHPCWRIGGDGKIIPPPSLRWDALAPQVDKHLAARLLQRALLH